MFLKVIINLVREYHACPATSCYWTEHQRVWLSVWFPATGINNKDHSLWQGLQHSWALKKSVRYKAYCNNMQSLHFVVWKVPLQWVSLLNLNTETTICILIYDDYIVYDKKALIVVIKRAQCSSDLKERHLERRELCNVFICLKTTVGLKVGISSGQNVKGCKQPGAGGVRGFPFVSSRESPSLHFLWLLNALLCLLGKRKSPSLMYSVF